MDSPNSAIMQGGPISLGSIPKTGQGEGLSKGARRMEILAWKDALTALKKLEPASAAQSNSDAAMKQEDIGSNTVSPDGMG